MKILKFLGIQPNLSYNLGIWLKWFYFRVVQYSDLTGVYLYKLDDRWRVSPNYENKKSWFFTDKGVETLTKDTKFYHGDDSSYKIHKSKFRVATLENVRDTCKLTVMLVTVVYNLGLNVPAT